MISWAMFLSKDPGKMTKTARTSNLYSIISAFAELTTFIAILLERNHIGRL